MNNRTVYGPARMAKSVKGKKKTGGADLHLAPASDPGKTAFLAGDFSTARGLLAQRAEDPNLSEAQRVEARKLLSAVVLDKGLVLVGLACLGLFAVAALSSSLLMARLSTAQESKKNARAVARSTVARDGGFVRPRRHWREMS